MATDTPNAFPRALYVTSTLDVPFPDARLASVALQALRVDKELSSLVKRDLTAVAEGSADPRILRVEYKAATNRMLRVAVNSFLESLALVLEVQEELDVDAVEGVRHRGQADERGRAPVSSTSSSAWSQHQQPEPQRRASEAHRQTI